MASEISDDFDYNSNDDDNWGDEDLDLIDDSTKILQQSRENSMKKENDICWKCSKCENINNVKLTIEKENMRCCGCYETYYIHDKTNTFQCSKWNNHNDYLLRIDILKQIKIWICNQCTFQNENIDLQQCEICESKRDPLNINKTILIANNNIQQIKIWICNQCTFKNENIDTQCKICESKRDPLNNTNIPKSFSNDNTCTYKWSCCNCNASNIQPLKCNICGCNKPSKFNNTSLSQLLTFGYIRQFIYELKNSNLYLNIPTVIYKLCQRFYTIYHRFERQIVTTNSYMTRNFQQPLKKFLCKERHIFNIIGEQLTNKKTFYRWRIKLRIDESVCDEIQNHTSSGGKRDDIKLYGISIGITDEMYSAADLNGNILTNGYGIHGSGSYGKYEQFCRKFMENDIITLEFDVNKDTLSYGINDDWFGIAFRCIRRRDYRFCICVKQRGVEIECLEFFEC